MNKIFLAVILTAVSVMTGCAPTAAVFSELPSAQTYRAQSVVIPVDHSVSVYHVNSVVIPVDHYDLTCVKVAGILLSEWGEKEREFPSNAKLEILSSNGILGISLDHVTKGGLKTMNAYAKKYGCPVLITISPQGTMFINRR